MAKKAASKSEYPMPEQAKAMGMPNKMPMMGGKMPMHDMGGGRMMPGAKHPGPMPPKGMPPKNMPMKGGKKK